MGSLWNAADRDRVLGRLKALKPDTPPQWGRFTAPQMLAHLNDALRMALGELKPETRKTPFSRFPMNWLLVYVFPWPRSAPTSPELLARVDTAQFERERSLFPQVLDRMGNRPTDQPIPLHPAFGALSRRSWGALGYRHVDHHFRQFGV